MPNTSEAPAVPFEVFFRSLERRDLVLSVREHGTGFALVLTGPVEARTTSIRAYISANKAALIAHLSGDSEGGETGDQTEADGTEENLSEPSIVTESAPVYSAPNNAGLTPPDGAAAGLSAICEYLQLVVADPVIAAVREAYRAALAGEMPTGMRGEDGTGGVRLGVGPGNSDTTSTPGMMVLCACARVQAVRLSAGIGWMEVPEARHYLTCLISLSAWWMEGSDARQDPLYRLPWWSTEEEAPDA